MAEEHEIAAAVDEINASLRLLRLRALDGPKARPTVKELNEIMNRLDAAHKHLTGRP